MNVRSTCSTCSRDGRCPCPFHKDFPDLLKTLRGLEFSPECWRPKDVVLVWDDKRVR